MKAEITLIKSGLSTSIQDVGRIGFSKYGVPKSGVMDVKSYNLANALVGNLNTAAVLEWTLLPPKLHFEKATTICCTGASIAPVVNGNFVGMNQCINVPDNGVLSFAKLITGVYGYIAIANGFQTPIVLGSRSMYPSITNTSILKVGNQLAYIGNSKFVNHNASLQIEDVGLSDTIVSVFLGPEFEQLSASNKERLFEMTFTIGPLRNRMGMQLNGGIEDDLPELLTSPVLPGTIQLTSSGKLIVLMRDCQTTGGYPRILQLSEFSISKLAQKQVGETIRFKQV